MAGLLYLRMGKATDIIHKRCVLPSLNLGEAAVSIVVHFCCHQPYGVESNAVWTIRTPDL